MTPGTILKAALGVLGLSQAEGAAYLGVSTETVSSWVRGRRSVPPGVWSDLANLWDRQTVAEQAALDLLDDLWREHGRPADLDLQATGAHGAWPSPGCAAAVAARIVLESRLPPRARIPPG